MRVQLALVGASIALFTMQSDAQHLAANSPPRFRSNVDLVTLDVCVKDRSNQYVGRLQPQDFLVLEDGVPQHLSFAWSSDRLPVAATLLLDHSGSMGGEKMRYVLDAATAFVDRLAPADRVSLFTFGSRTERVVDFDDDAAQLRAALVRSDAVGNTALYDAVMVALAEITRYRRVRTTDMRDVLVVFSDGQDNSSMIDFEELLTAVRRTGVLVYAVAPPSQVNRDRLPGPYLPSTAAAWPLQRLASDTGGRAIGTPSLATLPTLFVDILAEVSHLYRLGYVSGNTRRDGTWRNVAVRVPGKDVVARTRTGYLASRDRLR